MKNKKKKQNRRAILGSLGALFSLAMVDPAHAAKKDAFLVQDINNDAEINGKYQNEQRHPASLTKMMTLMLVFDALRAGDIILSDTLEISEKAESQPPSKIGVKTEDKLTWDQAIQALSVKSANDVALAVAENLAGSEEEFVRRMNEKALALGMGQTWYMNPHGLHDDNQITTARDLAKLLENLVENYQDYMRYLTLKEFSFKAKGKKKEKIYKTHNKLVYADDAKAGKTGYTRRSGFNVAVLMEDGSEKFIVVVMGGRNQKKRDEFARKAFADAYKRTRPRRLARAQPRIKPEIILLADGEVLIENGIDNISPRVKPKYSSLVAEGDRLRDEGIQNVTPRLKPPRLQRVAGKSDENLQMKPIGN